MGFFMYNIYMRRINPNTNEFFKCGDLRKDGYLFKQYVLKRIKKDGFFVEQWSKPWVFTKEKEIRKKNSLNWDKQNPSKACAKSAKRHAIKLQRTPRWDPDAHLIVAKYQVAAMLSKASGIPYHVDHIIPLQGKNVFGLHVFSNLRVIPSVQNIKKSNKYDV